MKIKKLHKYKQIGVFNRLLKSEFQNFEVLINVVFLKFHVYRMTLKGKIYFTQHLIKKKTEFKVEN